MRIYENLFIVRPDAPEEEIDALIEQLKQIVTDGDGKVEKADKWGIRKLAYKVEKRTEGFYVLLQYSAQPTVVKELERRMRVTDLVLKFITVRIDEKLKKLEKRTKVREKRAKRKPPAPALTPALPGPGAAMPGAAAPSGPTPGAPAPGAPMPAGATPAPQASQEAASPVEPAAEPAVETTAPQE